MAANLRFVDEALPGIAHARLRAIKEARYAYMSFVDDDNWITSNWIAEIHRIFRQNPTVAIVHCRSIAHLSRPTPSDFDIYSGWLAIGTQTNEDGLIRRRPVSFWTAGLSLRLAALDFINDPFFSFALTGRIAGRTLGGEDHELCLCILLAGWDAYATKLVHVTHDIPNYRLEAEYIETIVENGGRSRRILNEYRALFIPRRFPIGYRFLLQALMEFLYRGAIYAGKRQFGRLSEGISPSALSYRLARGKLIGYFTTRNRVQIARRNILITKYHAVPSYGQIAPDL